MSRNATRAGPGTALSPASHIWTARSVTSNAAANWPCVMPSSARTARRSTGDNFNALGSREKSRLRHPRVPFVGVAAVFGIWLGAVGEGDPERKTGRRASRHDGGKESVVVGAGFDLGHVLISFDDRNHTNDVRMSQGLSA